MTVKAVYYKWTDDQGLVVWLSWVDDYLVVGTKKGIDTAKKQMVQRFDCDVTGNMDEYVGCKIERNWKDGWMRFTQPVLLQSYTDEFDLPKGADPVTPAEPGQILYSCKEEDALKEKEQKTYRSGVGKLLHMMRWSRPDVLNAVRELSKNMKVASPLHLKAMFRVLKFIVSTKKRGLTLKPRRKWNGRDQSFKFRLRGRSDSDYASNKEGRKSVSGTTVLMEGAPVSLRSKQQNSTTLSVTEAELVSATECVQDMLFCMRVLNSMKLKVELPMILEVDNKGAVDLANNWNVGGRTRHIDVRYWFLRELKEQEIVRTVWKSGLDMSSDLFTKNLPRDLHEKHTKVYCGGKDEYMKMSNPQEG